MPTAADTVIDSLDFDVQRMLVGHARSIIAVAPLFQPFAGALPMSVRITNAGAVGWVADQRGYRYQPSHPNGQPWPAIPGHIIELANRYADTPWDCAHIVWYQPGAILGWHRDQTEHDRRHDIITFVIGDPAEWCVRENEESPITRTTLYSGDVVLLRRRHGTRDYLHRITRVDNGGDLLHPSPLSTTGRLAISLRCGGRTA